MKRLLFILKVSLCFCLLDSSTLAQCPTPPDQPNNLPTWINCKVEEMVRVRVSQRQNTRQTETPSISGSSTSLVDQSSASDLIGAALNLTGIKDDGASDKKSFSFTASGYSLLAAASSHDPLAPSYYLAHRTARRFWFTLGQEVSDNGDSDPDAEGAKIVGFKVLLLDKRDVGSRDLSAVSNAIDTSSPNFAEISNLIKGYLFKTLSPKFPGITKPDFLINQLGRTNFIATMALLTESQLRDIDSIIEDRINPEIELDDAIRKEVESIRKASQLSLSVLSKFRKEGSDEYKGELIYDKGLSSRINFTFNGGFEYVNSKLIGADTRGGSVAGQLQFQVTPEKLLEGRNPIYVYLSGQGKWMNNTKSIAKVQTKIKIPITDGIDLPISFTFANRTELIDEQEVRGQFGFTFDLARLARAVGFK